MFDFCLLLWIGQGEKLRLEVPQHGLARVRLCDREELVDRDPLGRQVGLVGVTLQDAVLVGRRS